MTKSDPGPEFWSLVRLHTGAVTAMRPAARGYSSDVTAVVDCEAGSYFVKAVRNVAGGRLESIIRERQINSYVDMVSPPLRWCVDQGDWYVLGFDVVDGRWPDFEPGSPDLTTVVQVLNRVAALPCPRLAREWPETRWNRFARSEEEAKLFEGEALLHTDINPDNILIGNGSTWIVDWSWPTCGAAFIDPACLVVQLVAAGHSAKDAEAWAGRCEGWVGADPRGVDAFAAASLRMYRSFATRSPEATWLGAMLDAAQAWADHRGVSALHETARTC
jgi:hypothetical protein